MPEGIHIMSTNRQSAKLKELRARTDRELVALIDRELDLAAGGVCGEAGHACADVLRLLPLVYNAPERRRLEARLAEVRNHRAACA